VLVLPWHNPALLAEQAATLDLLSNGRLDLGTGKGYRWGEFHGFCMPMEEAGGRYDEAVAFLRKAWTAKGRFSHHGRHWHYAHRGDPGRDGTLWAPIHNGGTRGSP
jgi:alkanesulfonate monooxygenase SsuD/methylene tetrahydromethanopterin reductase-like flavin-dependent oxidoreductase (luciferase family)